MSTRAMKAPFKTIIPKAAKYPTPTCPGHYWAKWRIASEGTLEGDEQTPSNRWEVVQVNENGFDPESPEYLSVSVPGVQKVQWPEQFFWGPGPLAEPK